MTGEPLGVLARRRAALARLIGRAPAWLVLAVGLGIVVLGMLIVFRPLTSIVLLAVYVGVSAIAAGLLELAVHRGRPWWTVVAGLAWIAVGIAVMVWFQQSLDLLPRFVGILLVVGGLASLGDAVVGGVVSQRVLAVAWGAAQLVFGVLAFTWPDATVLVVAVVFGVRTIVLGGGLVIRGGRALAARRPPTRDLPPPATPRRRALLAIGRYALAAVLVGACIGGSWLDDWLQAGSPVVDAFYTPPQTVPEGHGVLIRSSAYQGIAPAGGEVTRILYTTRDALGLTAVGSALVVVPTNPPPGPRPVVMWNHGTTGIARGCAPSLRDSAVTKWDVPGIEQALARGWVIVAPDYSGQGAPGIYPYLIGKGEARSGLDSVLAARGLADGVVLSDRVAVWGHSQGGHAALWEAQIAADYTPTLDIVGTAVLAPAADPAALARDVASAGNGLLSIVVAWVLVPYARTYPDVVLEDHLAPGAGVIVREMAARCLSEPGLVVSAATALGVSEDTSLYVGNLMGGALGRRIEENVPTGPYPSPIFVAWGLDDEVLPPASQADLVNRLCDDGYATRWGAYVDTGHQDLLQPRSRFVPVLLRWTQLRFYGVSADIDDCAVARP